jgi:hypothetical protein
MSKLDQPSHGMKKNGWLKMSKSSKEEEFITSPRTVRSATVGLSFPELLFFQRDSYQLLTALL